MQENYGALSVVIHVRLITYGGELNKIDDQNSCESAHRALEER